MSSEQVLDLRKWGSGSVAVWGAVAPIYDTTGLSVTPGVHVHARQERGGEKDVDDTYSSVTIKNWKKGERPITISAADAIHYMVAAVFGLKIKIIRCPSCKIPHLDEGWFSVNPHQKHLCGRCKGVFFDIERSIGNPLAGVAIPAADSMLESAQEAALELQQSNFPGGIQLWGSNPAIFWMNQSREQRGIHVHAFGIDGNTLLDETVPELSIDGLHLDADMVRTLMAQSSVPHLHQCVRDISCPQCGCQHFDQGNLAYVPHRNHICEQCGNGFEFQDGKESIGNPLVGVLAQLKRIAA